MSNESMIRCPHCGKMHPQQTIYCPENGMPIWQVDNEPAQPAAPPVRRRNVWIIVGAAVAAAVLCFGAVIAFLLLRKGPAAVIPTATSESIILATVFQSTPTPEPSATNPPPTVTPTVTETVAPQSGPWEACPGAAYLSRLRVGDKAKVSEDPPLANRVRSQPSLTGEVLGFIEPGEEMTILEGPGCSANWVWWRVRSLETGLEGWTAEGDKDSYWLVPDND